ncbi:dTMP kinase [Streptomyces sp. NBC_00572]|uniref:dTMP kinase n=1 Tax=Streptomyces sp. NBC_00572 TaxID=2903664 RepID=UPI00224EE849|nr:dTMP kinase [Streptomyces sp. NBC_00572]MCX4986912.1 dTMP kinase [Streptomyces sp. NBC_00572]
MTTGRGLLVAIEGPGGVGKSTATGLVARLLTERGMPALATREPTDTDLGNLARHGTDEYQGEAMACLIAADRFKHGEEIRPALGRGEIVVCDRYIASSLALQCMDGVDREFVWLLNERVVQPDLTVMVSGQPDVIEARLAARGAHSRYERADGSSHVECAYFAEAAKFLRRMGHRVLNVDASHVPAEEVALSIVAAIIRVWKDRPDNADGGRVDVQPQQPVPGARREAAPVSGSPAGVGAGADGDGAQRGV